MQILSELANEFIPLWNLRRLYLTVVQVGLYQCAFKTGLYILDIIAVLQNRENIDY